MYNVLLTGGSKGIGNAIKKKFVESGYNVYAPTHQELDLENKKSLESYIRNNREITFDVLINNAGINDINTIEDVSDDEMERMFQVNLFAPIQLIKGFVGKMKQKHAGRIVNISSIWSVVSKRGRSIYAATKHGIHGVTNTLAIELAPYNILVNTVCPGFTLTELTLKNNSKEQISEISREIPLGRMANTNEIAEVVFFLGSMNNTYLTGQKIIVDGGFTCK